MYVGGELNIPSPNIALKQITTTDVETESVHRCHFDGSYHDSEDIFLPILSPFYKQQRRLLSFIYARSFVSDVQMGVNKGRWEGGRHCARQIYLSSMQICQTKDDTQMHLSKTLNCCKKKKKKKRKDAMK